MNDSTALVTGANKGIGKEIARQLVTAGRRESLHRDGWHDMHLHARLAGDPQPALAGMMP
jgi:NAD(P)-dependent dehydrogenase (short-subunit alcohol dehydrogenase family)